MLASIKRPCGTANGEITLQWRVNMQTLREEDVLKYRQAHTHTRSLLILLVILISIGKSSETSFLTLPREGFVGDHTLASLCQKPVKEDRSLS